MKKGLAFILMAGLVLGVLAGCQKNGKENTPANTPAGETEISVFIAASLNNVMTELAAEYNKTHPEVKITFNPGSSGTLMTQIQEGYECDIFFSAAQDKVDTLEAEGLMEEGSRKNVVNNQVILVTYPDSQTKVTGLADLDQAASIALAGGSVPVGKYTRKALISQGTLPQTEDAAAITTEEVSNALGGVEISEQKDVSAVRTTVAEGSCEVGTIYYSDLYQHEDELEVLETVDYSMTGNIIYPICRIVNTEADQAQKQAAEEFYNYVTSDEAKAFFEKFLFDVNVE